MPKYGSTKAARRAKGMAKKPAAPKGPQKMIHGVAMIQTRPPRKRGSSR